MGRYFALTLEASPIQSKARSKPAAASKTSLGIWLAVLLAAFGMFYLLQVNALATKGYEIKKLEKRLVELREQQKRLELESASLQSIQQIEKSVKILYLVPSGTVSYPGGNGYAYGDETVQ